MTFDEWLKSKDQLNSISDTEKMHLEVAFNYAYRRGYDDGFDDCKKRVLVEIDKKVLSRDFPPDK